MRRRRGRRPARRDARRTVEIVTLAEGLLFPHCPGHLHHLPHPRGRHRQMEDHRRLRGHRPRRPTGHACPDRRLDPRPLEHRSTPSSSETSSSARTPRRPGSAKAPSDGRPQKPGDRSLEIKGPQQRRRRPTPPQPRCHTHPGHHPRMTKRTLCDLRRDSELDRGLADVDRT